MYRHFAESRPFGYFAALLLAVFVYFYGLDSQHIPRNGDEDVYAHITRLTAHSGAWLPLQSELDQMRNTKPPLLFWQGIVATDWGASWDRWHLRYPSVLYTLLTALLVFLLGRRLAGQFAVGATAALIFLAFFSTYRYGRPFLVNPAETFWLFLPFFTLLYWRPVSFESRWLIPLILGVEIGIGLLYKSFALLAPVGLALAWWYLHQHRYQWSVFLRHDVPKLLLIGLLSLSLFALWFAFDPDPQAVWREFVLGENAGKFEAHGGSYWAQLLWGGSSVWVLLLGYPMNAGLLALPVAALFVISWRHRYRLSGEEKLLWLWMVVLFVVFTLPSQRSARYLLEAMPVVALLCALNWQRLPRWTFIATLVASSLVLALLAWLTLGLQTAVTHGITFWVLLALTLGLVLLGLFKAAWTRDLSNVVALLTLLALAVFLQPFDGATGRYDAAAQQSAQGKAVWVPCNFRAQDEGYRFLLPGAEVHGYNENWQLTPGELKARYPLFAVQLPLQAQPCADCMVIGQRLELRGRHNNEELYAMLRGEVLPHLFVREWLLQASPTTEKTEMQKEGCR
ncbi:MAG: phospholipid carrier-dependent glycosyltransferase [Sideroxydans sp.]|jgi:hypothetical protein